MDKDQIQAAAEVAKEIVKPVYDDGLKSATQEVGKSLQTIAGVINIALTPLSVMVHGFQEIEQKLKDELTKKFKGIPDDRIKVPPLNIVGPLLEKYKYNYDSGILSDMFVSLLANSMDSEKTAEAHPAFIDIISQLSPDEAKLFKVISISPVCPKVDIATENIKEKGYNIIRKNLIHPRLTSELQYPNFVPVYLDNLQRLNLINFTTGSLQEHYKDENLYKTLLEEPFVKNYEKALDPQQRRIKVFKGIVSVSDFGRSFYRAITREVR